VDIESFGSGPRHFTSPCPRAGHLLSTGVHGFHCFSKMAIGVLANGRCMMIRWILYCRLYLRGCSLAQFWGPVLVVVILTWATVLLCMDGAGIRGFLDLCERSSSLCNTRGCLILQVEFFFFWVCSCMRARLPQMEFCFFAGLRRISLFSDDVYYCKVELVSATCIKIL
jgi:hypothetical protein